MSNILPPIVDGDGHVFENLPIIWDLMDEPYKNDPSSRNDSMFPSDHLHHPKWKTPSGSFNRTIGYGEWISFAKELNIQSTVVYPSAGLGIGRIVNASWANAAARAYNAWLYQEYLSKRSIFYGVALLPLQRATDAAAELRRAVTEFGMVGGILPPTGLRGYVGDEEYWPVFEAANELGCTLAVHGGMHQDLGLNQMRYFAAVHGLGHPFGIMISFASLIFNGIFEHYPNVRFAFLESGVSWVNLCIERLPGSSEGFQPWDPGSVPLALTGNALQRYMIDLFRAGRAYVGVEGDEYGLLEAIRTIGAQSLIFSSDFPHEVNVETCRHEIDELLENGSVSASDKRAILHDNALALYRIKPTVPATVG